MKTTVTLESKDVRAIIAKFLGISEENVIPLRYNFAVAGISAEAIERKIGPVAGDHEKGSSGLLTDD